MEDGKDSRSDGYWMFATSAHNKGEQTISGGVMERKMPDERITIYIAVNSVNEYAKKVEELGASYQAQD